jgi:hypothetical protein
MHLSSISQMSEWENEAIFHEKSYRQLQVTIKVVYNLLDQMEIDKH